LLVVIVPFRDEESPLIELLESLTNQTRLPDFAVFVDDGSRDNSGEIAESFTAGRPWAVAVHRPPGPPGGDRLASGADWKAFSWGLGQAPAEWTIAAKLDADMRLPKCLLEELEAKLETDGGLGIAGARISEQKAGGKLERLGIGAGHVHGAVKFYKRACWDQISPIPPILGWEAVDDIRARMLGWRSQSFELSCGDAIHLRPMSSRDGILQGCRRRGQASWVIGEHPLMVLRHAVRAEFPPPRFLCRVNYVAGWWRAALIRAPRAEQPLRDHIRREQWQQLRQRFPV
jgi:biofilm PGA synthesis N-glycosyltransferase PgaC